MGSKLNVQSLPIMVKSRVKFIPPQSKSLLLGSN